MFTIRTTLKRFRLGNGLGLARPEFLHVKELERRAVQGAKAVTYCSEADAGSVAGNVWRLSRCACS
jgi:hypothetical protein